ncbi:beta-lactamase class C binding protein-like protein [Coprinopsis sp. MPI-PUGE-AT-0042]|nr:beta-lactamase class C binding protein-like protein [Coprinopsis sp. MPI-PUGE-AT-0042]
MLLDTNDVVHNSPASVNDNRIKYLYLVSLLSAMGLGRRPRPVQPGVTSVESTCPHDLSFLALSNVVVVPHEGPGGSPATACPIPLPNLFTHKPVKTQGISKALEALDQLITKRAAAADVDSLAFAIVTSSGPIFEKGYGRLKANDNTTTQAPGSDSIYRLGSIPKMFTAFETLLLREKGILNLDDPIEKYLPDFQPPSASFGWAQQMKARGEGKPSRSSRVTIRQLASHEEGVGRESPMTGLSKWPATDPFPAALPPANLTLEEPVTFIRNNPLITVPNTTPIYSNVGYGILGAVNIAANIKANGDGEPKTHKELIQGDIFEPFGMDSSFFCAPTDNATLARVAVASGPLSLFADFVLGDIQDPAGGQYGSVADLAKLAQAFLSPTSPEGHEFLHDIMGEWLKPSYIFPSGIQASGMPWEIAYIPAADAPLDRSPGLAPVYTKTGDLGPYHNIFPLNPEYGYAVIALTTGSANPEDFVQQALRTLQPAFHNALEEQVHSAYVGKWEVAGSQDVAEVKIIDKQLFLASLNVGGVDILKLLNERRARIKSSNAPARAVPLWSTGRLDEFKMAFGRESVDASALEACLLYWATVDFGVYANGAPLDLVYWEDGELVYPSAGVRLKRAAVHPGARFTRL